jgi:hypothetical protein
MQAIYVIASAPILAASQTRATALGCSAVSAGDSTGLVTVFPSVIVTSSAVAPVVIADNTGQATLAAVQTAQTAATTAETTQATNHSTILSNVQSRQSTIKAWIAANPSGAVLTAAQTLVLAEMLDGLCDLLLDLFSSTTGT